MINSFLASVCHAPDPAKPLECAPSDQNSTEKDVALIVLYYEVLTLLQIFRDAIWTPNHLLFGAGFVQDVSSRLHNYWQFHTGFVDRDTTYIPDDNGIASVVKLFSTSISCLTFFLLFRQHILSSIPP